MCRATEIGNTLTKIQRGKLSCILLSLERTKHYIVHRNQFDCRFQQLSDDDDWQGLMYYPMDKRLNSKFLAVGVLLTPVGGHELMLNNHQATNIGLNWGSHSTELI